MRDRLLEVKELHVEAAEKEMPFKTERRLNRTARSLTVRDSVG